MKRTAVNITSKAILCLVVCAVVGWSQPAWAATVANGNFETSTAANPPSGWTKYLMGNKSGNWTIQTVTPPEGTQWQQTQVYNTSSWAGVCQNITGLLANHMYTISGSYKTNSNSATASVRYSLTGDTTRNSATILVRKSDTAWGTFSRTMTASGTSFLLFLDHATGTSSNKASAYDNITVTWAGPAAVLTNRNFEASTVGNPPVGWTTYVQSSMSGIWTIDNVSPPEGLLWQQTQVVEASAYAGIYQNVTGLTAGSIYTISGTYRTNSITATASVRYSLGGDTDRANSTMLASTSNTVWGTFAQTVTASGSSLLLFLDHLNGTTTNKVSAFDNINVSLDLLLTGVVSRKTHGAAGSFDINVPLTGVTTEPRDGGPTQLVMTFNKGIYASDGSWSDLDEVSVSAGVVTAVTVGEGQLTVDIANVPNGSCLTVSLSGITNSDGFALSGDNDVKISCLVGDVDSSGGVNATDTSAIHSHLGETLSSSNAFYDVNVGGSIDVPDKLVAGFQACTSVTCP